MTKENKTKSNNNGIAFITNKQFYALCVVMCIPNDCGHTKRPYAHASILAFKCKTATHRKRYAFLRFLTTSSQTLDFCFLPVYVCCDCVVHPHTRYKFDAAVFCRFFFACSLGPLVCCSRIRTAMRADMSKSTSVCIWMWMGVNQYNRRLRLQIPFRRIQIIYVQRPHESQMKDSHVFWY